MPFLSRAILKEFANNYHQGKEFFSEGNFSCNSIEDHTLLKERWEAQIDQEFIEYVESNKKEFKSLINQSGESQNNKNIL